MDALGQLSELEIGAQIVDRAVKGDLQPIPFHPFVLGHLSGRRRQDCFGRAEIARTLARRTGGPGPRDPTAATLRGRELSRWQSGGPRRPPAAGRTAAPW